MKNDCYKCPFRGKVIGSAHSSCKHPAISDEIMAEAFLVSSYGKALKLAVGEEIFLETNEYGASQGWAMWPLNFDPTWITCKLPLP